MQGYIFYGPPGSGKSTTVRAAKELGIPAVDLEHAGDTKDERKHYMLGLEPGFVTIVGGADQSVTELRRALGPWWTHVLILPDERIYRMRRTLRDAADPSKAQQVDNYADFAADKRSYDLVTHDPLALLGDIEKARG